MRKLRLFKIAPGATGAALFGYTCALVTDPALVTQTWNALILTWLGLLNIAAVVALAWALITDDLDELRAAVHRQRASPRLRFLHVGEAPSWVTQPTAPQGSVYGAAKPAVTTGGPPRDPFEPFERQWSPEDTGDVTKS